MSRSDQREFLSFQRREWLVQRVGWVLLALTLLAALAGLFGDGPLAARTRTNDAATLEYEAFARRHAGTDWTLRPRAAPADGVFRVAVDADFAKGFRITEIQPEPSATRIEGSAVVYEFAARGAPGATVVFHVEPLRMGLREGGIRAGDAPPFAVSQFVYP